MMRSLSKTHLVVLSGILTFGLSGVATSVQAESGAVVQLAKTEDVAGKGIEGACKEFGEELFDRMDRAGVEAYLVRFQWEAAFGAASVGRHVIVVFRDEKGALYGMDNELSSPRKLKGELPRDWAKQFARGLDSEVYGTRATRMARFAQAGGNLLAAR